MRTGFDINGNILSIDAGGFKVPFRGEYGFFIGSNDIVLENKNGTYVGVRNNITFLLSYNEKLSHIELNIEIVNNGAEDIVEDIGFHTGIDSYMESYPQWHKPFFPTLLRCEKTHIWGYYMNTKGHALALASSEAAASYDIIYNMADEQNYGHRICGTDIVFIKNARLPDRHPQKLCSLKAGEAYRNTIYLIPVNNNDDILRRISEIAGVPMIWSDKYTYEKGDALDCDILSVCGYKTELICPNGSVKMYDECIFDEFGVYKLMVYGDNGKISEAVFCCRKD